MFYNKNSDESVLDEIIAMLKLRSTYGYKRITAMINKSRAREGLSAYHAITRSEFCGLCRNTN